MAIIRPVPQCSLIWLVCVPLLVSGQNQQRTTQVRLTTISQNWQKVESGTTKHLYGVGFASSSIGVTVGSDGTILRSTTGGSSWSTVASPTQSTLNAVTLQPSGVGFIAGVNNILKTTDYGDHWTKHWLVGADTAEFDTVNNYFILTSVSFPTDSIGYAGGFYADVQITVPVLFKTTNAGETWQNLQLSLQDSAFDQQILIGLQFTDSDVGYIGALSILDTVIDDTSTIYTLNQILKTTNGGITWSINSPDSLNDYIADFAFISSSTGYAVGSATVFKTNNAAAPVPTWSLNNQIPGLINAIASDGIYLYCVGPGGNIISSLDGIQWTTESSGVTTTLWDITAKNGKTWAVGDGGTILIHDSLSSGMVSLQLRLNGQWNIVSLPLITTDSSALSLFPTSVSNVFGYTPGLGYQETDTLHHNYGYWIKFPSSQTITITGYPVASDTFSLKNGWNLIGSITAPIPVGSIIKEPSSLTVGNYFDYNNGYAVADTIEPGKGYWVKASEDGRIILTSSGPTRGITLQTKSTTLLNRFTSFTVGRLKHIQRVIPLR